jgi:hypothetical protein
VYDIACIEVLNDHIAEVKELLSNNYTKQKIKILAIREDFDAIAAKSKKDLDT